MRFFLDGNEIANEPNGDIITSIRRDQDLGGFVITNDAQLKWNGDGYDYLQSVIESAGFCGEIDCEITDECTGEEIVIFKGKIFILEIRKDSNCIITAPLQDNSYYARINKNKSIKITIDTVRSKNDVEIEGAKQNAVSMFDPFDGSTLAQTRALYRVYDVFKNMVAFMSDGEVAFDSNLFGTGGEFAGLSVGMGLEIAFPSGNNPITDSFDSFFKEVRKKINCTFYVDTTGTTPTLRVEKYTDLFVPSSIKSFTDVLSVKTRVDTKRLISVVTVGSDKLIDILPGGGVSFVEDSVFQTFKTEDYTLLEQCNRDEILDLVSRYVLSSNVIEDAAVLQSTAFEDDIFFVDCENLVDTGTGYTSNAIEGDPYGTGPPVFYNTRLFNSEVLDRWLPLIPNDVVNYSGSITNKFRASFASTTSYSGTSTNVGIQQQFSDDFNFPNFDGIGSNNYGNGTAQGTPVSQANSYYTCPETGAYTFEADLRFSYNGLVGNSTMNFIVRIRRETGAGAFIQHVFNTVSQSGVGTILGSNNLLANFTCNAGDKVRVIYDMQIVNSLVTINGTGAYANLTFFAATTAPNQTGKFILAQNAALPIILSEFEYTIENSDFYDIVASPFSKITFSYPKDKIKSGWIDTLKFNHRTSIANLTLIGSQDLLI